MIVLLTSLMLTIVSKLYFRDFFNTLLYFTTKNLQQIWPWLAQIGYRRAGWYGYDWIDNDGIKSADRIIPQLQRMKVGDDVPIWKGNNFKVVAVDMIRPPARARQFGYETLVLARCCLR